MPLVKGVISPRSVFETPPSLSLCRCTELMMALESVAGGCTLCSSPDFERDGFGARTMIICDQCEREFHVGCLKDAGKCELESLPEGAQLPHQGSNSSSWGLLI